MGYAWLSTYMVKPAESVGFTWGGRWKSIQDYGHTEYRMPGLKKTAGDGIALLTSEELSFKPITFRFEYISMFCLQNIIEGAPYII